MLQRVVFCNTLMIMLLNAAVGQVDKLVANILRINTIFVR
jgi:hypothetical protein